MVFHRVPLYWRIENFPTLDEAQNAAAASPTSLAAAVSGKVWLFTLGQKGGTTAGGTKVAEVGPVPVFAAPENLLRINRPGSTGDVSVGCDQTCLGVGQA